MQTIIYTLLTFLNGSVKEDTPYQIGLCLLEHLRELPSLSLQEAADLCHVSVATLNRFCKTLGLGNYSTLREHASHRQKHDYPNQYDEDFIFRLSQNLQIIEAIHLSHIDQVVDRIHQARNIILLGYGDFQFEALYFQKHLFSHGKYARLCSDAMPDTDILKQLTKDDLIILTSIQLDYIRINKSKATQSLISQLNCQKVLITQSNEQALLALFDVVLSCGPHTQKDVRTYTILHMYDRLIARYHEKYCPEVYE